MPPSVRVRITGKAQSGPCDYPCGHDIREGERHVTVTQTFGRAKESGKTKYRARHLHIICLAKWLIGEDLKFSMREKEKGGRPTGSLPGLSTEDGQRRKWLVRTRARLIREIIKSEDAEHTKDLHGRAVAINRELGKVGGAVNANLVRRSPESRKAFLDKTRYLK